MAADPTARSERAYILRARHDIALFDVGDEGHNVIVVGGIDLVVPVEMDLDGDPMLDDRVSLRSIHGLYEQVLTVGDADVRPDPERRVAYYRFRDVPPGLYRIAVRIAEQWVELGSRLSVRRDGAYWNDQRLDARAPDVAAAEAEGEVDEIDGELEEPHHDKDGFKGCCGGHDEESDG